MPEPSVADQLGRVVGRLPAGQVRDGQVAMAEAVAKSLTTGAHVAVMAGTGTGKSFAYLVPAALSGKRVVVATATKALQDQLATKDLPLVASGLQRKQPLRWAVLKGRSNYICRQRLVEMEQAGRQGSLEDLAAASPGRRSNSSNNNNNSSSSSRSGGSSIGDQVGRLVEWSATTATGDRAELDFEPHPTAWSAVSVAPDECPGAHRCPSGADCFTERARAKAGVADIVIVNLHLLGADLRSGGAVLPEHQALVIDEAHELEDVLGACLGVEVSPGRLRAIAVNARACLPASAGGGGTRRRGRDRGASAAGETSPATGVVAGVVGAVMGAAGEFEETLGRAADQRLPKGLGDDIGEAVRRTVARLVELERELRAASGVASAGTSAGTGGSVRPSGRGANGDLPSESAQRVLRAQLAVERCREELESCLVAEGDEVVWVAGGDRVALKSAPLDVSAVLRAQVFSEMPVVLTSATLPPGLAQRLGAADAVVTELDVGSPFDYRQHGLLYCATRLPDRRRPNAEAALHAELEVLVRAAGGRTLGLFTSYRAMQAAADALRPAIPWPIHLQGDLPKPALLQAFSGEEAACLFATMGFWQGVDVPGPTLSLVVIDRLPFPRPDDPLMSARRDAAGPQGFRAVDLPRAATLLAQGAGRLIRTETDRGVVAVLDPRLATASYSGYLVRALPPMRRTREQHEAVAFLQSMHAPAKS
jgi:ATP-dependent DNA helicase DinG